MDYLRLRPQPQSLAGSPPSSPLSLLSQSPSPPSLPEIDASNRYPSPSISSAPSGSASPIKMSYLHEVAEEIPRPDGAPPAKRRRITTPRKPRTTDLIDLENLDENQEVELDRLVATLRKKKRIVVIAGAGISVSAGIPDFRSSTGLFATARTQHKVKASGKHLFDASVYKHDSSTSSFHTMVRELAQLTSTAKPTPFHHMLASIAKEGRLMRLYSQNVDCIDTDMPPLATTVPLHPKGPWPTTIQLHGGLGKMVCSKCGHLAPFDGSLFEGPEAPLCQTCREHDEVRTFHAGKRSHGIGRLRPRIVLYNEYNPDEDAIGMVSKADLRRVPDAVVVVGTSLKIPGVRRLVKEMCQVTRSRRDGLTAWINIDPEPQGAEFKDCWDFVVRGKCDDIANMVRLPHWDDPDYDTERDKNVASSSEDEKPLGSLNRGKIDALLARTPKKTEDEAATSATPKSRLVESVQGSIPTPSASPKLRSPLPTSKIAAPKPKAKATKQSTLNFGGKRNTTKIKNVPPTKVAKSNKSRQKKETVPLSRNLTSAFKSTKNVPMPIKNCKKEDNGWTSPVGSSPPLPAVKKSPTLTQSCVPMKSPTVKESPVSLPSLRPAASVHRSPTYTILKSNSSDISSELTFFTSSPTPCEPQVRASEPQTISPTSKPRSMNHLID